MKNALVNIFLFSIILFSSCKKEGVDLEVKDTCEGISDIDYYNCLINRPYYESYYKLPPWKWEFVSLIKLIATPERFDKRQVGVDGYLKYDIWKYSFLYMYKNDMEMEFSRNFVLLEFESEELRKKAKSYDGQYVNIVGIFYDKYEVMGWGGVIKVEEITLHKKKMEDTVKEIKKLWKENIKGNNQDEGKIED